MSQATLAKIKYFESEFMRIKQEAGTHSPSMSTLRKTFPNFKVNVDACFLSNPYATDLVMKYLTKELFKEGKLKDIVEHYPSQQTALTNEFAGSLHVRPENVFLGNGAIEIIQALMHRVVGKKVVIPIPTFSSYYEFKKDDTEVVYYPLSEANNFHLNGQLFIDFIKNEAPDTVVLINPNNPNGGYIPLNDMRSLLKELTDVKQVIIDESFIHFAYEDISLNFVDTTSLFYEFDNVIIVKSLSKDFGVAGIRVGYALMQANLIERLLSNGYLWNLNGIAESIIKIISQKNFKQEYKLIRKKYIKVCQEFFNRLRLIQGIQVYPSLANFVLIKLPNTISASFFVSTLLCEYGIYVRTAGDKIGLNGEFVRIAVRTEEENKQMIDAISLVMKQFSGDLK